LTGRSQTVRVGDCFSTFCHVISGVPQESVLGPVLFVLFINDIANCSDDAVAVKLFADDAKLYTVISNESSAASLQSFLDYVLSWSDRWQLKLSPSKCTVMHLTSPRADTDHPLCSAKYSLCGLILPSVSTVTDLRVCYDRQFSFRPHINRIVAKASLRAKLILKCFVSRDPKLY